MPGLIRGVVRTAAIAGTATAVSNRVSRRQQGRWAQQEQQEYSTTAQGSAPQPAPAAPAPAPAAPAADEAAAGSPVDRRIAQLKALGNLRDQGVLTDAEFAEQKARVLGG